MAKRKKSLVFSQGEKGSFFSQEERAELLDKLPLLFEEEEVIVEQFFSFYRAVLREKKNLIFLSSPVVVSFLRNFLMEEVSSRGEQFIGLVDSSRSDLLLYWKEKLPPKDTALVVLARPLEELQLLLLAFSFPQWEKVLVGSNYGILAQSAQILFLPFLPTEIYHHYFWQRSALLYLPLISLNLPVEELEEGFKKSDYLREEAAALSLFIKEMEEKGIERVNFLVDNSFILSILQSFIPLLEYSCKGEGKMEFRAFDFSMMRDGQLFLSDNSIFILVKSEKINKIKFTLPSVLKRIDLFSPEGSVPTSGSWKEIKEIECRVVENLLYKEGKDFLKWEYYLPDFQTTGELMTFVRYLVSYNAWLRGLDLWSDPPVAEFDNQIWRLLASNKKQ
ncbi:hypothetical protein [Candidatus Sordicultor fermentans]|uniref:hypothetical protein n=1 Tax=Candidatus Sordicultor fermentans TaxID=1953203 RepID=UPI0016A5C734|nr:hypothetical protein [Candidatus Atribacteria bacterium]